MIRLLSRILLQRAANLMQSDSLRTRMYRASGLKIGKGVFIGEGVLFDKLHPFRLDGLLELPLTMPQEVYLRHVYGLSAEAALGVWLEKLDYIRSRGGVAVFNIHPVWIDRSNLDMFEAFTRSLDAVAAMDDVQVATPSSLKAQIMPSAA